MYQRKLLVPTILAVAVTAGILIPAAIFLPGYLTPLAPQQTPQNRGPDFEITANPAMSNVAAGSPAGSILNITSVRGFTGIVTLQTSISPTQGGITAQVTPSSVSLSPGGTKSSTLSVATTNSAQGRTYSVIVSGTSGRTTHTSTLTVNLMGLRLSIDKSNLTIDTSSAGQAAVSVSSLNGFTGDVTLSATTSAAGPSVSLNPPTLSVGNGQNLTSTLTVASSALGSFDVTVVASSGQLTRSVTLSVTVIQPGQIPEDFSVTSQPPSLSVQQSTSGSVTIVLTSQGCTCTVNLAAGIIDPIQPDLQVSLTQTQVGLNPAQASEVPLTINTGASAIPGSYTIQVTAQATTSGGQPLSHVTSIGLTITGPVSSDYSIGLDPVIQVRQGSSTTVTVSVHSIGGFTGTVDLTTSLTPSGQDAPTVSLGQASLSVPSGGTATATVTIQTSAATAPSQYDLIVTGQSQGISHTANSRVHVQQSSDFTISLDTGSVTVQQGGSVNDNLVVSSVSSFTGMIILTASPQPSGLTVSANPSSVTLTMNQQSSTITVSADQSLAPGTYPLTITGTDQQDSTHSVSLSVTVTSVTPPPAADFEISTDASSVVMSATSNNPSMVKVTLQSLNGWNSPVSLTLSVEPSEASGPMVSLDRMTLVLTPQATSIAILSLSCDASTVVGAYTVTIMASGDSVTHSAKINLTIG